MPMDQAEKERLLKIIKKGNIHIHRGWKNFSKNIALPDVLVLDIKDIPSLQTVMKTLYELNASKAVDQRILLRVAAGGKQKPYSESFSFTEGSTADVIIRLVGDDFNKIEKTNQPDVMRIGASVQVGEADKMLYEEFNLSLPTASLIPYVTVSGLAANAGHGTGKDQPSFSGLIRKMTLCLPNGEITQIDDKHPDFDVIRGANLGLFGVIINMELACTEAKKMQCIMQKRSIPELIEEIKNGLFLKDPYVSVMYVPTYQKDELVNKEFKNVIIYRWQPIDKSNHDVNNNSSIMTYLGQQIEIDLEEGIHVVDLLRRHSRLIPYYNKYLVSQIAIGKEDRLAVAPWYRMHYQKAYPWDIVDADYLFQVHKNCDEMVLALEKVVTTLDKFASEQQYPVIDAIYLRLFRGTSTNSGLSTSSHADDTYVCGFDMVTSDGIAGYLEFREEMCQFFINGPLKAKPHWGKYLPDIDYVKLYGKNYTAFLAALKNWYHDNNMKLDSSMLLTDHFCQILQLPYAPSLQKQKKTAIEQVQSKTDDAKIIKSLCVRLDDKQDIHSINLKQQLLSTNIEREFNNPFTLFQMEPKREDSSEEAEKKKRCCVVQ